MGDISLSKAVRSNLLSLQNTSAMMAKTQERLATGNKVNSALDNPTNFFTAAGLNSRAGDLNQLMDSMANGIQTLEAADNGLTAITKTLESMQSTLRQARQDKSFQTESFSMNNAGTVSFSGGAFATEVTDLGAASVEGTFSAPTADGTFSIAIGGIKLDIDLKTADAGATPPVEATTLAEVESAINSNKALAKLGITMEVTDATAGEFTIHNASGKEVTLEGGAAIGLDAAATSIAATGTDEVDNVDDMVRILNNADQTKGLVRASNDNGTLRIENLSTNELAVSGLDSAATIAGNTMRADLADQYNELRDQLDKLADDASFNGINLLRGDKLTITFNETGTSSIDINTKGQEAINSANLGIETFMQKQTLDSDSNIDAELAKLKSALNNVRSQSSAFGSNLSIVQNRQDFTKNMVNTLQTGGANLTLADMNEEAANLLALQTRQSLSSNSLSLASQADQSVLQLIR